MGEAQEIRYSKSYVLWPHGEEIDIAPDIALVLMTFLNDLVTKTK
jgi:hypothetical protein